MNNKREFYSVLAHLEYWDVIIDPRDREKILDYFCRFPRVATVLQSQIRHVKSLIDEPLKLYWSPNESSFVYGSTVVEIPKGYDENEFNTLLGDYLLPTEGEIKVRCAT